MAAQITASPVALMSFVYADCVIHKSRVGVVSDLFERQGSFWSWVILQPELFVVADATLDERFKDSPLVAQARGIRFFAGVPLITSDGYLIGTLEVMDCRIREWNPSQAEFLKALASSIMAHLDLQYNNGTSKEFLSERLKLTTWVENSNPLDGTEYEKEGTKSFHSLVEQ